MPQTPYDATSPPASVSGETEGKTTTHCLVGTEKLCKVLKTKLLSCKAQIAFLKNAFPRF